jgi:hypothetical protein
MIKSISSSIIATTFIAVSVLMPIAGAGQAEIKPLLMLWEFDGWAKPTPERPLGLRFVLLENGRVVFSPDEPAVDSLIPNNFFQARLSAEESQALNDSVIGILSQHESEATIARDRGWTAFYFRDAATGQERRAEVAGHPCLASGRVFSANAAISGEQAARNGSDRAALSPALRTACNILAGFHHSTTQRWVASESPVPLPEP